MGGARRFQEPRSRLLDPHLRDGTRSVCWRDRACCLLQIVSRQSFWDPLLLAPGLLCFASCSPSHLLLLVRSRGSGTQAAECPCESALQAKAPPLLSHSQRRVRTRSKALLWLHVSL